MNITINMKKSLLFHQPTNFITVSLHHIIILQCSVESLHITGIMKHNDLYKTIKH